MPSNIDCKQMFICIDFTSCEEVKAKCFHWNSSFVESRTITAYAFFILRISDR